MKFSIQSQACRTSLVVGGLMACCLVLGGCQGTTASKSATATVANPVGTPAPVSNATVQQQVQNDPNISPERKQQITDSLARSQQAANDQRQFKGRPAPVPR